MFHFWGRKSTMHTHWMAVHRSELLLHPQRMQCQLYAISQMQCRLYLPEAVQAVSVDVWRTPPITQGGVGRQHNLKFPLNMRQQPYLIETPYKHRSTIMIICSREKHCDMVFITPIFKWPIDHDQLKNRISQVQYIFYINQYIICHVHNKNIQIEYIILTR